MAIRSVLVIPFADGIGDFINMQPLLPVIRARFPEAEITVAVSEHGNLLCNDPAIRTLKPASFNHEPGRADGEPALAAAADGAGLVRRAAV